MFAIYKSDYLINPTNCLYPTKVEISDQAALVRAVSKDYVCALYKDNYRSVENFLESNCLAVDCDNDHSEDPSSWVDLEHIKEAFPDVRFAVHYSRNHQQDKGNRKARPRFHVFFPIETIKDAHLYAALKQKINGHFPYFDTQAMDAGRFFFGTPEPVVEIVAGNITVDEFIEAADFDDLFDNTIIEGARNSTMSKYAARIIKKYGDNERAFNLFYEKSGLCSPLLPDEELNIIWGSAQKFYKTKVLTTGYIPPEVYNDPNTYIPDDLSDVGQAVVLNTYFANELRYSPQTHFIRYKGACWVESQPGAQYIAQELTRRQLNEARTKVVEAYEAAKGLNVFALVNTTPKSKRDAAMNKDQKAAFDKYSAAKVYEEFAVRRRSSANISATLKEAQPLLEISFTQLDADPFLLCTPEATYNLRKGMAGRQEHKFDDFITKITAVSPGLKGKELWLQTLDQIFGADQALINYVQRICGLAVIGKVYVEALIISYGDGGNGKSTFWNAVSRVLGTYSGNLSADTLTVNNKRNIKPEMAELRGKRLIMAAESQEGARLNDSIIKQLCSTDAIFAEKKYKDPFSFIPSHTLLLYTNHLPKVSANDDGVWRRLIVIPFKNKMTGDGDIKNFADELIEKAGEYILHWIIEGAEHVIKEKFKLTTPAVVAAAIDEYREQNDWMQHFINECCELDLKAKESALNLYKAYTVYCTSNNEYTRSNIDFSTNLEKNGFKKIVQNRRRFYVGLRLKNSHNITAFENFLT